MFRSNLTGPSSDLGGGGSESPDPVGGAKGHKWAVTEADRRWIQKMVDRYLTLLGMSAGYAFGPILGYALGLVKYASGRYNSAL
eukprot:1328746-Rhodomonas_salina.6